MSMVASSAATSSLPTPAKTASVGGLATARPTSVRWSWWFRVGRGTLVSADEEESWNDRQARYAMQRINHRGALQQLRWRLHERRGGVFLSDAPGRGSATTTTSWVSI